MDDFNKIDNQTEFDELSNSLGIPSSIGKDVHSFNEDITIENKEDSKIITFSSSNYQIKQYLTIVCDDKTYTPSRLISKLVFVASNLKI